MRYWFQHLRRPSTVTVLGAGLAAGVALALLGPVGARAESTSGTTSHIVRSGDTVGSVAARYGVDADDIRVANGIIDDNLYLGSRLVIDGSAAGASDEQGAPSSASTYEVEKGDVLIHIARDHGVRLSDLLSANGLNMTSLIMPGDELTIPGSRGGSSGTTSRVPRPRVVCPVPGASFMNSWGFPRGSTRFHEGTDLFAPAGETIVAPVTGQLTFSRNNLGGKTFTIDTPSGWVAYGAHLSATVGDSRWVAAGEVIGAVGDSGNARGTPHLHFEMHPGGGGAADPYPVIAQLCQRAT